MRLWGRVDCFSTYFLKIRTGITGSADGGDGGINSFLERFRGVSHDTFKLHVVIQNGIGLAVIFLFLFQHKGWSFICMSNKSLYFLLAISM